MNFARLVINAVPLAFGYCCLGTVIVQVGGGIVLWSTGALSQEKLLRFAAIAYGLDVTELPAEKPPEGSSDESDRGLTRQQRLAERINAHPILADRKLAMRQEMDRIRTLEKEIKSDRDRRAKVRENFRSYLDELKKQVIIASLGDVQRTLENLSSRQAKDILLRTMKDEGLDPSDDVMQDVVTIVKAMPQGKLKKILGEFKTDREQEMLHEVLEEIGRPTNKAKS